MTDADGPDRRQFLKGVAAGIGAAAVVGGVEGAETTSEMPTITIRGHKVSRLVCGSNPVLGYSHVSQLMSRLMTDYFTHENIVRMISRCLEVGVTTWQTSYDAKIDGALDALRASGKDVQWIFLANRPHTDPDGKALKEIVARNKPIAVVHHGGVSDSLWRQGQIEKAHDFAKRVQDLGVAAGLSAHNPDVIAYAEEKGWNLDLYMTCFYRVTRTHEELLKTLGQNPLGEVYLPGDPAAMCKVVRQVKRPCLGFKILAAGRRCDRTSDVESAFRFALQNIKRTDGVIVGMFPRFADQVGENAGLVRQFAGLSV